MGKLVIKKVGANVLELLGTALQIASEITTFVAGMGFFIAPLLKKMYAELLGKNVHYTVTGSGELCIDSLDKILPLLNLTSLAALNTSIIDSKAPPCLQVEDQSLLASNILFDFPYPKDLFAASVFLFCIGCTGLTMAFILKTLGASLHEIDTEMPPSGQKVARAQSMQAPTALTSTFLYIGSRGTALYATSTISTAITLRNIPDILQDLSISSSRQFSFDNGALSFAPELANKVRVIINLTMKFITKIDFTELRNAAALGSKKIDAYDYNIGLAMAVVAFILGHLALKIQQQNDLYTDILARHKLIQEWQEFADSISAVPPVSTTARLATNPNPNPNRMFVAVSNMQDNSSLRDVEMGLELMTL